MHAVISAYSCDPQGGSETPNDWHTAEGWPGRSRDSCPFAEMGVPRHTIKEGPRAVIEP